MTGSGLLSSEKDQQSGTMGGPDMTEQAIKLRRRPDTAGCVDLVQDEN